MLERVEGFVVFSCELIVCNFDGVLATKFWLVRGIFVCVCLSCLFCVLEEQEMWKGFLVVVVFCLSGFGGFFSLLWNYSDRAGI